MNRADYNVGTLEAKIEMDIGNAQSSLKTLTSSIDTLNTSLSKLLKNTGLKEVSEQAQELSKMSFGDAFKSTIKFGAIYGVLRKGFNTVKDIASANIDMIETTNLFEVQMGKVVDEYGNLDEAQSTYYTKAMAFQDKMNEKLATNKSEMQKYQAMYYGMLNSQLGSKNRNASYLMSESLTKAGYDIASLYNLNVEDAMNKLKSGLAGQIESLRQIGIDVSEASLAKVLDEVGIERSVQKLSYAEKEIARYIAIVEQAGQAQGDFARTFEQPANQLRIFQNQLIELKQVAGSFFIGLFSQIMPYINGIIMAIKEVLKALGSVFGFEVTGTSSLEEVADTVGDIDSGIGSATKKAKEFKKQLMGFDEINNITPPTENKGGSSGTVTGVDSALLDALKEWDNKMDSISGKAQEIRDKILDWLGVTDGSYENLKKILEIAKLVGVAIGSWKIASTVSNFFKSWGKLSKTQAFQLATGITLTITGLIAQFNGTKQLISGNWSLFNLIETALGTAGGALGIVSIMKALKLGTNLNLGQKLSIGFGIMLEIQGLQVTKDAIKELKNSAEDANEAFSKLTIGIGESIGAGALLGGAIGGINGAIIGGLLGALGSGITALQEYNDINIELKNSIEENGKAIEESTKSIENRTKIAQDSIDSQIAELEYIKKLTGELDTYVEANGKVKKGYEDRVDFILGELNTALGTEYSQVDGVIQKYEELKDNVYKVIDAKKAEIILNANEKLYADAIQNITKHYQEKETAINNNKKAQEELNKVLEKYGLTMNDYTNNSYKFSKAITSYSNIWKQDLTKAVQAYNKTQQNIDNATKNWTDDCKVITDYENLKTATITGNQEEINKTLQQLTSQYETETGHQTQSIQEQINQELELVEYKKQRLLETQGEINSETEAQLNAGLESLANNLVAQTKTIEDLTPNQINAWKTLAEGSEKIYNEKILQLNPDTQLLLETLINTTGKLSPVQIQQWANMAKNSKEQYEKNLSGLDTTTSQRIQSCVDAINNKKWTAEQTAQGLADAVERGVNTIDTTYAGKQAVAGVTKGINQNKDSSSLWNAISGVVSNVKRWFNNMLGIHSPSRVFADLASYIPAGIAKGITDNIDTTTRPIKELTNNITDTFSNNIDVPNIAKELNQGIKINPKDFEIDTNQYINYSAIKGQILAQSQVNMNENIASKVAEASYNAFVRAMRDEGVNIEIKAEEGIIFKKVQNSAREYTMQTGEPAFGYR